MIPPRNGVGGGCIKKVADSGGVAGGGGAEVQGGQGVASGCVMQDVSKQGCENRYQRRGLSAACSFQCSVFRFQFSVGDGGAMPQRDLKKDYNVMKCW